MKKLDWRTIVTALIAVIAFSVQWGVVTTKLDSVEKRLDEFLLEARAVRAENVALGIRVAVLEAWKESQKEPH